MTYRNEVLSLICRQTYVDIGGGGLLYQLGTFHFSSLQTMENYLRVINPAHRACIRSVQLFVTLTYNSAILPTKIFQILSSESLPSLQSLEITFYVEGWVTVGPPGSTLIEENVRKGNWGSIRGNLKEFDLAFRHTYGTQAHLRGDWVKELVNEIKLRVMGSSAVKH
jgi:hypothetical protein